MKRYNYTITELLTVIAIIAILAGIAIPSIGYARKRARTTSCISNQGQTMKTLLDAMNSQNNFLYSGTEFGAISSNGVPTANGAWTQYLADKGYIKSMDALRCTDMQSYTTESNKLDADSIKEAYGVVVSAHSGKFDFRGTKLLMNGTTQIAPAALALGGCSTTDGKTAAATINFGNASGDGKPTGVHHNNTVNMFFYDGHAENFDKNTYKENKYTPKQTSATAAEAVVVGSVWQDAVK